MGKYKFSFCCKISHDCNLLVWTQQKMRFSLIFRMAVDIGVMFYLKESIAPWNHQEVKDTTKTGHHLAEMKLIL